MKKKKTLNKSKHYYGVKATESGTFDNRTLADFERERFLAGILCAVKAKEKYVSLIDVMKGRQYI